MNTSLIKKFFVLTSSLIALYFTYGFVSDTTVYVAENNIKTEETKPAEVKQ